MSIEWSPDLLEHQRLLRRALEDVEQAQDWFVATAWARLRTNAQLARAHGVTWKYIERWVGSATTYRLRDELESPKEQWPEATREPPIAPTKQPPVDDGGYFASVSIQSILHSSNGSQSQTQSISSFSTQNIHATTSDRGLATGGVLIVAGNPHEGRNRFDEEIGTIQTQLTGYLAHHPELDVTLDRISIGIDRHRPEVLHVCATSPRPASACATSAATPTSALRSCTRRSSTPST